jgi:hypothetical protein
MSGVYFYGRVAVKIDYAQKMKSPVLTHGLAIHYQMTTKVSVSSQTYYPSDLRKAPTRKDPSNRWPYVKNYDAMYNANKKGYTNPAITLHV